MVGDAFLKQFEGKTAPVAESEIETVSGATITSKAVIAAVNEVLSAAPAAEPEAEPAAEGQTTELQAKGFTGTFGVAVTLDANNAVSKVTVQKDAGTGDDAVFLGMVGDAFLKQFEGKTAPVAESEIETVSGATITSKAVIAAVNEVLSAAPAAEPEAEPAEEPEAAPAIGAEATTRELQANGYTGTFVVTVGQDENGAVTGVTVKEGEGIEKDGTFLAKINEKFLAQFVGKTAAIGEGEVETVSGATLSSLAVINAVNEVLGEAAPAEEAAAEPEAAPAETAEPETEPEAAPAAEGQTTELQAKGLTGTFGVAVTLDANNAVSAVTIKEDEGTGMDASFVAMVGEAFLKQFEGKTAPVAESEIETVSGATTTSKAVIAAVNEVLSAAPAAEPETVPAAEPEAAPAAEEAPVAIGAEATTRELQANGYTGTFAVTVGQDENGAVTSVTVKEGEGIEKDGAFLAKINEKFLSQFVGKTAAIGEDEVETVSGATLSSLAVISAVNEALGEAAPAEEAAAEPEAAPAAEEAPAAIGAEATTRELQANGYTGTFTVTVGQDENGAITSVTVKEGEGIEKDGAFLAKINEKFLAQFVGRTAAIGEGEVETVSGATVSSLAVIDVVNEVLSEPAAEEVPAA